MKYLIYFPSPLMGGEFVLVDAPYNQSSEIDACVFASEISKKQSVVTAVFKVENDKLTANPDKDIPHALFWGGILFVVDEGAR